MSLATVLICIVCFCSYVDVLTLSEFCKKQQQLKQLKLSLNGSVLLCRGLVPPKTDEVLLFSKLTINNFAIPFIDYWQ